MSEYLSGDRRKSKNDKKKKAKYGIYQKGGKFRATKVKEERKSN